MNGVCERCGAHDMRRVADLGGCVLMRCGTCQRQQLRRQQEPRGVELRAGVRTEVVEVAGEIEAMKL